MFPALAGYSLDSSLAYIPPCPSQTEGEGMAVKEEYIIACGRCPSGESRSLAAFNGKYL